MEENKNSHKVVVAGNIISIDEFLEEAYNLCRVDQKVRELKKQDFCIYETQDDLGQE